MIHILNKIIHCRLACSGLILISIILASTAHAQTPDNLQQQFKEINDLVSLGAPGLALRMLEKRQPILSSDNLKSWLIWEKKRIQLIQKLNDWPLLVERVDQVVELWKQNNSQNEDVNQQDISWFQTQQIKAQLNLGNNSAALALLQYLLWNTDGYVETNSIAMWRRLVIRSYLQMNKREDAQRAMRRYQQDYGNLENEDGLQWTILQMQLLLQTNRYHEVVRFLSDPKTDEEKVIKLVAKLDGNLQTPQQIKAQLKNHLSKNNKHKNNTYLYDFVLLKVAIAEKNLTLKSQLIEKFLTAPKSIRIKDVFYDVDKYISADSLWLSYEKLGYQLANRYKLLRGDDDAWYLKASNLFEHNPMQAKAMYRVLAFSAQKQEHRTLAFEQLVKLLDKQESGIDIINALFMKSTQIKDVEKVPVQVRYRLVDYALSHADLKSAAKIMKKLQQPPPGEDAFAWNLRRARILIMGGQYQQGANILNLLLANRIVMTDTEVDQYMQVLFDLQAIEQHVLALQAFEKLGQYPLNEKIQREIAFWKAESYQAQGEYEQAAYLFLKSARPLNDMFDPWYHTASFKAAESLAQAELIDDARRQYVKLLRITKSAARKSVIKQRLQQLRLLMRKGVKTGVEHE